MLGYFSFAEGTIAALWDNFKALVPELFAFFVAVVVIFVAYKILTRLIFRAVLRTVKGKPVVRKAEEKTLRQLWRYGYFFIAVLVLVLTFSGSLAAAGIGIGLLSASLGWALQKPITGIAGWVMILVKKPFKVGDRIVVDGIVGDVADITMFYIVLEEIGGTASSADKSGRDILVPTSVMFEKNITNYTLNDEYVLEEIVSDFTYEGSLEKAERIMVDSAEKFAGKYCKDKDIKPFTRLRLAPSSVQVAVRYYAPAKESPRVMTEITREIFSRVGKEKGIAFAYPHTELVFGQKPFFLRKEKPKKEIAFGQSALKLNGRK